MIRITAIAALLALALGIGGCKSEAEKLCLSSPPKDPKHWVSACGEACEMKKNEAACAKQSEVGQKYCFKKGNIEICRWMCEYAKSGKELYCKRHKALEAAGKK